MFTTWDKALSALVLAVVYFVNTFTKYKIPADPAMVNAAIVAIGPIVVWATRNKSA